MRKTIENSAKMQRIECIWKREFSAKTTDLDCALRFRIAPDIWPNIKIKEADLSPEDIFAHAYEDRKSVV